MENIYGKYFVYGTYKIKGLHTYLFIIYQLNIYYSNKPIYNKQKKNIVRVWKKF